ncbi:MAG: DEAD/DEAH box helicase [Pseudomonadota bacterium]
MQDFSGVARPLAQALEKRGYEAATPVQQAVLNAELVQSDLLVSARTGSGKTVAFGIAAAPNLLGDKDHLGKAGAPLALIITPTRELALQVMSELQWLYGEASAKFASCVGGMNVRTERQALQNGAHIVVGTPGRLRDHISRNALNLSNLKVAVLDEADEMLDLGFREDLEFILAAAPEDRRTLMFSATVPKGIERLAQTFQRDAIRVQTDAEKQPHSDIEYKALLTTPYDRENAVTNLLRFHEAGVALVFCNTRAAVSRLTARLSNRGFSVVALSGELGQAERNQALQSLRDGRARVCVATDVAARGIDLPNLELVIHAELPTSPDTLLHRSGRTGRAGRKGISAMLVDPRGRPKAERLLRFAKVEFTWGHAPSADDVMKRDEERMLAEVANADAPTVDEGDVVHQLADGFTPAQLATAFLRLWREGNCAPEEIDVPPLDGRGNRGDRKEHGGEPKPRNEFERSVWLSLSVGRKQRAEPRWLIPLLCKSGGINKRSIGSIKMHTDETRVELDGKIADAFLDRIGPDRILEKSIRVKVLDASAANKAPVERENSKPKNHGGPKGKPGEKPAGKPGGKFAKKPTGKGKPDQASEPGGKQRFKPKAKFKGKAKPNAGKKPRQKAG